MKKQYISPQFNCSDYSPDTAISASYAYLGGVGCECISGEYTGTAWIISFVGNQFCDNLMGMGIYIDRQGEEDCDVSGSDICGGPNEQAAMKDFS